MGKLIDKQISKYLHGILLFKRTRLLNEYTSFRLGISNYIFQQRFQQRKEQISIFVELSASLQCSMCLFDSC